MKELDKEWLEQLIDVVACSFSVVQIQQSEHVCVILYSFLLPILDIVGPISTIFTMGL